MKIETTVLEDSIICETDCDTRHYRSRYRGYTRAEAEKRFRKRVIDNEQAQLDKVRLEAILMCFNCEKPEKEEKL